MTATIFVPEIQVHDDKYHGQRMVETYHRIKVHTNEAPPILDVTKRLFRQESPQLEYTGEIIRLGPNEVKPIETRTADLVLSNVAEILQFLNKEGYDPTELPPCVVKFRGEYYIINGHHQTAALIERGQSLWIYDVYEYLGPDDFNSFQKAVKSLGKKINLVGATPKHDQKPFELVNGYVLDIQKNFERTGVAHLLCKEDGTPIPLSKKCVESVLEDDGFTAHWGPDKSSGLKSVYTKAVQKILEWQNHNASNIRSFTDSWKKKLIRAGKFKSDGKISDDQHKCYMVCTDNPNSDGVKLFLQAMSSTSPVRFLSYSKETDDPQKVIENEKAYLKKAYNAYVESVTFHNDMVENFEDNRVCDKLKSAPYSYEQFLSCFEWWAVAQLDDEGVDVVQRSVL